jgi:uncharacterized protein (TIGR00255 family)
MINGMTGFGRQNFSSPQAKGFIEIRSLNHKYFDIVFHLPQGFGIFEERLKRLLHSRISRGRVTVSLVFTSRPEDKITVRQDIAKNYLKTFKSLNKSLHLKSDLGLSSVITLPGVIRCEDTQVSPDDLWPCVEKAANAALSNLLKLRRREGDALRRDIGEKIKRINAALRIFPPRIKEIAAGKKKILSHEEFSAFLRASDINEELTRLSYHLNTLKSKLSDGKGAGKEMDFISQELQREINTIGAKLLDKTVSETVIRIKSLVEKIREQLQNIE